MRRPTLLLWRVGLLCRWEVYLCDLGFTEIGCDERWLMERGEMRFVTHRCEVWG